MTFLLKKSSAIDRRLKNIEKEIAGLSGEIKAAARSSGSKKAQVQRASASPRTEEPEVRRLARDDVVREEVSIPRKMDAEVAPMQAHEREKFVNYFSAHNFNELRPVRESGNVLRNKAIMMAVLAALAVIGIIFHMFGR